MSDICESCGCPEGVDGHDVLHMKIDGLQKDIAHLTQVNKDLDLRLGQSIEISNKNADQAMLELSRARKLASILGAAERGRSISDAAYSELQDFMTWATGEPKWADMSEMVKKKWLLFVDYHRSMGDMHPVYLAERALIRSVLALDSTVREFDGDLKPASEHIDALWDTVKRYRNVKLPVRFE